MSTLGTIENKIRANLGESVERFYSTSEMYGFIGEGYKFYVLKMIEQGEGYFETTENIGFTADDPEIDLESALSATFFSIVSLERNTAQGTIPLEESRRRFKANSILQTGVGDGYRPTYKLRGNILVLEPRPRATEAGSDTTGLKLDFNFVPAFPDSVSSTNFSFDSQFPVMYETNIELWTTIAMMEAKDGMGGVSDINSFRLRLEKADEAFFDSLQRSEYPDHVVYVGDEYDSGQFWGY